MVPPACTAFKIGMMIPHGIFHRFPQRDLLTEKAAGHGVAIERAEIEDCSQDYGQFSTGSRLWGKSRYFMRANGFRETRFVDRGPALP